MLRKDTVVLFGRAAWAGVAECNNSHDGVVLGWRLPRYELACRQPDEIGPGRSTLAREAVESSTEISWQVDLSAVHPKH